MLKKQPSLKKKSTIKLKPDFSRTCGFHKVVDNAELITYMKFPNSSMIGCKDMDKNCKYNPKMEFSPICDS